MKVRTIYLTCKIPDSDWSEGEFFKVVNKELGSSVTDSRTLINTDEMYKNDSFYRSLSKSNKKAKKVLSDYIHKNNSKWI